MGFTLPTFNLTVNIWRNGNPTSNPPDIVTLGNLAYGRRVHRISPSAPSGSNQASGMYLLLPPGTDVRDGITTGGPDVAEVGAGTGRFYDVLWVDDAGGGFANEHRVAELVKKSGWPVPIPSPGVIAPPTPGGLVAMGMAGPGASMLVVPINLPPGIYAWLINIASAGGVGCTCGAGGSPPLTLQNTYPGVTLTGITNQCYLWTGFYVGGSAGFTVTNPFGSGVIQALMYASSVGNLESNQSISTSGGGSFNATTLYTTSGTPHWTWAGGVCVKENGSATFSPPLITSPPSDIAQADGNGNLWYMNGSYWLDVPGLGPPLVATISQPISAAQLGWLHTAVLA